MFTINIWAELSTPSQLDAVARPPIASCAYYLSAPPVHHRRRYRQTRGLIRLQFLLNIDMKQTTSSPISPFTFAPQSISPLFCYYFLFLISIWSTSSLKTRRRPHHRRFLSCLHCSHLTQLCFRSSIRFLFFFFVTFTFTPFPIFLTLFAPFLEKIRWW